MQRSITGISRLRGFQLPAGGFVYWPGGWAIDQGLGWRDDWGTTYAGHFLLARVRVGEIAVIAFAFDGAKHLQGRQLELDGNLGHAPRQLDHRDLIVREFEAPRGRVELIEGVLECGGAPLLEHARDLAAAYRHLALEPFALRFA